VLLQGDVRPAGCVSRSTPGCGARVNSLMASLSGMQVLALLVLAFLLAQLRLLFAQPRAAGFPGPVVRHLRIMAWTMVGLDLSSRVTRYTDEATVAARLRDTLCSGPSAGALVLPGRHGVPWCWWPG
jgi:hypothetical protein